MEYTIQVQNENQHYKYKMADNWITRLVEALKKEADKEKIVSNTILFKDESIVFINAIGSALSDYKQTCIESEDVTYTDEMITALINDFQVKTDRIAELRADTSINYLESSEEFIRLQEDVAKLKNIRDKLIEAGWVK